MRFAMADNRLEAVSYYPADLCCAYNRLRIYFKLDPVSGIILDCKWQLTDDLEPCADAVAFSQSVLGDRVPETGNLTALLAKHKI